MDEVTSAPTGEGEAMSVDQAVAALSAPPDKPRDEKGRFAGQKTEEPATSEESGAAEQEFGEFDDPLNVAQPQQAATDEDEGKDPAELPPLDLPRSWSKDRAEHWTKLDRETQEFLLDHDSKASAEVRRAQNEAAEKARTIEAERQAYEQARQQYEQAVTQAQSVLYDKLAKEFPDIQTYEDLRALKTNDPIRFMDYQILREEQNAYATQYQQAQEQRAQENQANYDRWKAEESKLLAEKAPEFADPKKLPQLVAQARETFADIGVSEQELAALASGQPINFNDHRVQLLIRKALRYDASQKALKNAATKPVPPVQRPGTATAKGERHSAQIETLSSRLNKTHSVEDAVALLRARRGA